MENNETYNVNTGIMHQIIDNTGNGHTTEDNRHTDELDCSNSHHTDFNKHQISGHTDDINNLNKDFREQSSEHTDFINITSNGTSLDHSITECSDDAYRFNNEHPDVVSHLPSEHSHVIGVSSDEQPLTPVKSHNPSPGKRINDISVEDAQNSAEVTENGFPDVSVAHSAKVSSSLLDSGKRVNELPVEIAQNLSERTENGFPDVSIEHSAEVLSSLLDSGKRANELPVEVAQNLSEGTENGFPDVTVLTLNFDDEKYNDPEANMLCCDQPSNNNNQENEIMEPMEKSTNALEKRNVAGNNELLEKQTYEDVQTQKDDRSKIILQKIHSQIESHSPEKEEEEFVLLSKEESELESVINEDSLFLEKLPQLESVLKENDLSKEFKAETDNFTTLQKDILLEQPQNIIFNHDPNHSTAHNLGNNNTEYNLGNHSTEHNLENHIKINKPENYITEHNPDEHTSENKFENHKTEHDPEKESNGSLNVLEVKIDNKPFSQLATAKNALEVKLVEIAKNEGMIELNLPSVEQNHVSTTNQEDLIPSVPHEKKDEDKTIKESNDWLDILGNGLLKKKILKRGLGHKSRPVSGDIVTIKCKGMLSDGTIVDAHDSLQFVLSDEEVIQAFDLSVALMENTEVACIFTDARYAYGIYGRPNFIPPIPQNASLTYEVEILSVKPGPDITQLSSEERINYANAKRERGNELYMIGDHSSSINVYKRGLKYVDGSSEMNVLEMKVKLLNNLSAAQLKVNAYAMAIISLDSVLRVEPKNTKALFRKGKCLEGLGNDEEALKCLKEASTLDPQNKLIHQDIAKVRSRLAVVQKKEKEIYEKMFSQKKKEKVVQNEPSVWPYIIGSSLVAAIGVISGILWFRKHS